MLGFLGCNEVWDSRVVDTYVVQLSDCEEQLE